MPALAEYLEDFIEDPGYLDFATFGPLSNSVADEAQLFNELLRRGRYGSLELLQNNTLRVKDALANALGFEHEQIVFQRSIEVAYFQLFFSLSGGLLISAAESPSAVYAAVRSQQALSKLVTIWLATDYGRITPSVIREQLTTGTEAIFVSQVDPRSGHIADLEGIREVIGDRLLIVDATQGLGVVPAPYHLADVVVGTGSRWLRAGFGTGFLAISERAQSYLRPILSGYQGAEQSEIFDQVNAPLTGAQAFRMTEADLPAQARMVAALERIHRFGVEPIYHHLRERVDTFVDLIHEFQLALLSPLQSSERSGIVSVAFEQQKLNAVIAALHNQGISATQQQYSIRFSIHNSSTDETFEMVREALAEVL